MAFDYAAKIQALLANADDESLSDETRAMYRTKAEELMDKYRIAEEDALATEGSEGATPVLRDIRVTDRRMTGFDMSFHYQATFSLIANHCGVKHMFSWDDGYVAKVVGYEGDIRYAEFLWTSALLMFATRIDPRWDDALSVAENIWRLRNAGIQRRVIADRAWGTGHDAAARSKVQRVYLAECRRRGEEVRAAGLGHQTDTYRYAYAEGFRSTLGRRLREARDAADSVRGGLVLHGRAERVAEAFYTFFPSMRPRPYEDVSDADRQPCPKCSKAKSGHCRDHPAYAVTKSDLRRWARYTDSPSAQAGRASGKHAAEGVVVSRGFNAPTRVAGGDTAAIDN